MRILITLSTLGLGGTESYSLTVAEQLERLGHPVRLHAARVGPGGRELAADRGLRLSVGDHELGGLDGFDAVIAQDLGSAYALAAGSERPRLFVCHGLAPFELPTTPAAGPVVALNDRILARLGATEARAAAVRLRQPIDIERFRPLSANRPRARRLLALSNSLAGDPLRLLEDVCEELGLELVRAGGEAHGTTAPERAIAEADIVVGYGRSVLEAMAMGKAAYVWERAGGDGWVTPETYPDLEADGFSGAATEATIGVERLRADLAAYTPDLGLPGYDLVRTHHSASKHAEALVRLLLEQADSGAPPAATGEERAESLQALALMLRAQSRALGHVHGLEREILRLHEVIEAERRQRLAAEERAEQLLGSRTWRLTEPLRRAGGRIRARAGGRRATD